MLIKSLLYTGVRVAELVSIRLGDVDLDACRIRITHGKGAKDRYVPFPATFKETLALHISAARDNGAAFLFESSWKKPYSTRGVRAMLARYASKAGLAHNMPPHRLRHFLFTWLKGRGVASDATFRRRCEVGRARVPALAGFRLRGGLVTGHAVISGVPVSWLHWMAVCGTRISCTE